ncbi:alpha-L-fucosidase [Pedobacter aquatilis]|uniref:alpha-L-fucosidase n=1 Tax=Pedobacter aquatilis TaxID=351343 RepID=UPI00292EAB73|nr:alpha-L-fucosidase [Pedobacter aquatilis]
MIYRLIIFCLLFGTTAWAQKNDVVEDETSSNYNLNKPEREEWLRNTGAGLFIHFNVDAQLGIVISHSLVGASDDYTERYFRDLPKTFNPASFNPKEIAELAKLAGMKYIVFTTKHHAGFCFWDTKTTDFKITNTPYKKDLLKEFVNATREAGLDVGFYFSPEDFNFLYKHKIPISRNITNLDAKIANEYAEYNRKQTEELMQNYGKIDVLFIDGDPKETVKETAWEMQPDILITRGAILTPEQTLPGAKITQPWLSPVTIGTAWQYQPTNERYKSGSQLIELLIEARSKGGSLLLNVGPKANGALAEEQENRLREMAGWYYINHEAMDDVRSWVVSKENNIYFTRKGPNTVFAIIMDSKDWKEGERRIFNLKSVKSTEQTKISVLGQNSQIIEYKPDMDVSSRVKQIADALEVSVVKAQRIYDDHKWPNPVVIKLENVAPVFAESAMVQTGLFKKAGSISTLNAKILNYKEVQPKRGRFYYRPYRGQVETLYADAWKMTDWVAIKSDGTFAGTVKLPKGAFEYKAVAEQQNVIIEGENKVLSLP